MKKKHLLLLIWPVAFLLLFIAKSSDFAAEFIFARGISKIWLTVLSLITRLFPFSLAELSLILIGPLLLFFLIRLTIRTIKKTPTVCGASADGISADSLSGDGVSVDGVSVDGVSVDGVSVDGISVDGISVDGASAEGNSRFFRKKDTRPFIFLNGILSFVIVAGFVFFSYVIGCGVNYYRYTFTYYSGYEIQKSPVSDLEALCYELAETACALREELTNEDEFGAFDSSYSYSELADLSKEAYSLLAEKYPVLDGFYPGPKTVFFSSFMSEFNITGVFFPFTAEANVNVDIADYSIPVTMCHELTHLRGFMREDEANYLAYAACMLSPDKEIRYSGVTLALINAGNALYDADHEAYYRLYSTYSEELKTDFRRNNEYWDQYEDTVLSEVGNTMNDTYLKLNDQEDGIKSYGRMVDLLLAEYHSRRRGQEP